MSGLRTIQLPQVQSSEGERRTRRRHQPDTVVARAELGTLVLQSMLATLYCFLL